MDKLTSYFANCGTRATMEAFALAFGCAVGDTRYDLYASAYVRRYCRTGTMFAPAAVVRELLNRKRFTHEDSLVLNMAHASAVYFEPYAGVFRLVLAEAKRWLWTDMWRELAEFRELVCEDFPRNWTTRTAHRAFSVALSWAADVGAVERAYRREDDFRPGWYVRRHPGCAYMPSERVVLTALALVPGTAHTQRLNKPSPLLDLLYTPRPGTVRDTLSRAVNILRVLDDDLAPRGDRLWNYIVCGEEALL